MIQPEQSESTGDDSSPAFSSVQNSFDETTPSASTPPVAKFGFGPPEEFGEVGTLGPYRILRQLGKGAMGAVFVAFDPRLDRWLAIKVMLPEFADNLMAKQRFLREARAAGKIDHDNIVTIYEADEYDGVPFIAMQLLQGWPLDEYLKRKGRPDIGQILRIGWETADGLAAAHEHGLIHRDIKPANLWLETPKQRIKVLDFGLAKPVTYDTGVSQRGAIIGTPAYMSPEQARGEALDHRTDLFSLGAVLYELCTEQRPFPGKTTMALMVSLATHTPRPVHELNPTIPKAMAQLIQQLLAKEPSARPQSAAMVAQQLRDIDQEPILLNLALPTPPKSTAKQPSSNLSDNQRRFIILTIAAILIFYLGYQFFQIQNNLDQNFKPMNSK